MIVNYCLLHDYCGHLIESGRLNGGSTFCNSHIPSHGFFVIQRDPNKCLGILMLSHNKA